MCRRKVNHQTPEHAERFQGGDTQQAYKSGNKCSMERLSRKIGTAGTEERQKKKGMDVRLFATTMEQLLGEIDLKFSKKEKR